MLRNPPLHPSPRQNREQVKNREPQSPIEEMLRGIEEVQIFLLTNPEEYRQLSEPNLIGYALIKLYKCGGMYAKALERWNKVLPKNRKNGPFMQAHDQ